MPSTNPKTMITKLFESLIKILFYSFVVIMIATPIVAVVLSVAYPKNEEQKIVRQEAIENPKLDLRCGQVTRVIDGDTFEIRLSNSKTARIRLNGIDTPEYDQPYGDSATQFVQKLIFRKHVIIEIKDTDMYGRIVCQVYVNDTMNLCQELLRKGLAWHDKKYDPTSYHAHLELQAKHTRIGLWADSTAIAPWDWRKM